MKGKIIAAIIASVTLILSLLVFLTFKNSTGCDQLVIDSYELHSGINIPNVDFVNCYCDEGLNTRIAVYDLHTTIDMRKFEPIDFDTNKELLKGKLLLSEEELPARSELFIASGEKWGRSWTYLVDTKNRRLWAELNY